MRLFMINLFCCSAVLSLAALIYDLIVKLIGERYSPKWRFISYKIILSGFFASPFFSKIPRVIELDEISKIQESASGTMQKSELIYYVIFYIWLFGAVIILSRAVAAHKKFVSAAERTGQKLNNDVFYNVIGDDIIKKCVIIETPVAKCPMTIGIFKPKILLPKGFELSSTTSLALIHEINHIKRHDSFFCFAKAICKCIHWFNPLFFIIAKRAENECEISCDELTVAGCNLNQRESYCRLLLNFARQNAEYKSFSPYFARDKRKLKGRINEIFFLKKRCALAIISAFIIVFCIAAATLFGTNIKPHSSSDENIIQSTTFAVTYQAENAPHDSNSRANTLNTTYFRD